MKLLVEPLKTEQIVSTLRNMIMAGGFAPNSRLTGVRDLAQQFKVSTRVISCALETLEKERLIRCEHGRGIFVAEKSCKNKIITAVLTSSEVLNPSADPSWFNSQFILEGFCSQARQEGVITDIMYLHPDAQPLDQGLEILLQNKSDAFIFTGIGGYQPLIERLIALGKNVIVRHSAKTVLTHNVYGMMRSAICKAVSELIANGCRNIAFFGGPDFSRDYEKERLLGYTEALEKVDIAIRPELIRSCKGFSREAYLSARKMFDEGIVPDAIFGGTDLRCFGIMQAISDKGLRIPDDIAIFGTDNLPESSMQHPPLSSIDYPLHLMGRIMFDIVKEIMEKPVSGIISRSVECNFIKRESC